MCILSIGVLIEINNSCFDHAGEPEYTKGMKVFTLTLGGLMYEATVAGQKFIIK